MSKMSVTPHLKRIQNDIETLAGFVDESKPGWTRRPFTVWYEQGRQWLRKQMLECGMEVEIDSASNLIGTIPGSDPSLKPIMVGSHTDTVTGGGRFDGIIGVVAGIELIRILSEAGITLRHPLKVVDFTAEEPSEFGISCIGSRGMVDNLSKDMLERKDPSGLILKDAVTMAGGRPETISQEAVRNGDIALYLELHIEQGPVLEKTHHQLGVVTGIVGIHRYRVTVKGKPNHAGTTPMNMRNDALVGASHLVIFLQNVCGLSYAESVVGTVGKFNLEPNASNVIPERVVFDLEVRSLDMKIIEGIIAEFKNKSDRLADSSGLDITMECLSKSDPIRVSQEVQGLIREACEAIAPTLSLPSGAGHDANQLARVTQIGMIFVPSKDGRSHCSEEWTSYEEVALGAEAIIRAVLLFDDKTS